MSEERKPKRDRFYYLNAGAELVTRRAYRLCRESLKAGTPADLKTLKDLCGLLKEAAALSGAVEKTEPTESETLRVVFEGLAEDYAR